MNWKRQNKKQSWPCLGLYPGIYPQGMTKTIISARIAISRLRFESRTSKIQTSSAMHLNAINIQMEYKNYV
jgi:hypothetical protein